ncbi:MAG: ATP-binding cassette domain-containing protein, partial [Spirochaetaceae bacterium]|nr:ATP-binding cassette domain-containing protein [Spirochaetaceae bacterium]
KSTALQLLNGLASADRGRALAFGEDLSARSTDLRRVRMRSPLAIQRPESALFETYAGDDVAFGPRNQGLVGSALVERVRAAMAETGLDYADFRDRRVRGLSGGEKRKLALAGVLALNPDALLLDEPGSALDPSSRAAVLDLIRARARGERAVVMATHDMEAAARADFVAVLSGGELVAFGPPSEIFSGELPAGWGISPPFACAVARELALAGLALDPMPLDEDALSRSLAPALALAQVEAQSQAQVHAQSQAQIPGRERASEANSGGAP